MGLSLCSMALIVRRYRQAQFEVALSLERRRRIRASSFNFNVISSKQSLSLFRFLPAHVGQLVALLEIDVSFSRTRLRVDPPECFCIVLRRLASPCRWVDLEEVIRVSGSVLCHIFHATVDTVMNRWGFLLSEWCIDFMRARAVMYAEKIAAAGAYLDRCLGFIDGTALFIARPRGGYQRACYSGHKRKHAVKFQIFVTPDGLFFHLFGPWEWRRHEMTLYHESGLDDIIPEALVIGED